MSRWACAREGHGGGGGCLLTGGDGGGEGGGGRGGGGGGVIVVAPRSSIKSIPRSDEGGASLPSVVLDHVSQLDDEFSLFVLLTTLKRMLIFPTQGGFTVFTVDVSHSM